MDMTKSAYEEYELRVRRYSASWFQDDAAAMAVLRANPVARTQALALSAAFATVGTDVVYEVQPDRWRPERLPIHSKIVATIAGEPPASEPSRFLPIAVLLMGLPGSGKGTFLSRIAKTLLRRLGSDENDLVDADRVRSQFPEYAAGLGSEVVQVECAYVTYAKTVERAFSNRRNLILDTVGDPRYSVRDVEYLTQCGWSVVLLCASIDIETAVQRSARRALEVGRYVPESYIRSIGDRPIEAFRAVRTCGVPMVAAALLDTGVPADEPPGVLESSNAELFGRSGSPTTLWENEVLEERGGCRW